MRLPEGGEPCPHASAHVQVAPPASAKIYKDECTQCFHSSTDVGGIIVCAQCFNGGCDEHALRHAEITGHAVGLRLTKQLAKKEEGQDEPDARSEVAQEPQEKRVRIEGGNKKWEWSWEAVCSHCGDAGEESGKHWTAIDRSEPHVQACAIAILEAKSAAEADAAKSWENIRIQCEHTVMLEQPPPESAPQLAAKSLAHCGECELGTNLWLCMTCGHLGCGRKNWDGSGGNHHAVDHHAQTGHVVVCKLGTITPEGDADIFCYGCDDERLDPMLTDHLGRFGLDILSQKKTEKTVAELELEQNLDPSLFSRTQEGGLAMKNVYGPGYTGLTNLGNTCYMASVLQASFALPEFQQRYFGDRGELARQHISTCTSAAPASCFLCQMHKLAQGLLSGDYAQPPPVCAQDASDEHNEQEGIPPTSFKSLLCADHPDFSTMQQQDAEEFFQFMVESIRVREGGSTGRDPTRTFTFEQQERLQCISCKKVRYTPMKVEVLALPMATDYKVEDPEALVAAQKEEERLVELRAQAAAQAESRAQAEAAAKQASGGANEATAAVKEDEKPKPPAEREDITRLERASYIPFSACINQAGTDEVVSFKCSDCGSSEGAVKRTRISKFPQTLAVVMRRFTALDWVPRKLGFQVRIPDDVPQLKSDQRVVFDFESLRGATIVPQEGETLMASGEEGSDSYQAPDEAVVSALEGMGFPRIRAQRAAFEAGSNGPEAAMEWLLMHMEDSDIDTPLSELRRGGSGGAGAGSSAPAAAIQSIAEMGFSEVQAKRALSECGNDVERSLEWLFTHADEPMDDVAPEQEAIATSDAAAEEGPDTRPAKYELCGFVEHRGTSTRSGHYVAYLFKEGRWVQFNDRKVCETDTPPAQFAYMYFFRRCG